MYDHGGADHPDLYRDLGLSTYQNRVFSETYGVGQVDLSAGASIRVFSHLTESIQKEIEEEIKNDPSDFEDLTYLATLNDQMKLKHSFLMVTKNGKLRSGIGAREPDLGLCGDQ